MCHNNYVKKEVLNNLIYFFIYFVFVTLFNKLFSFTYWPIYLGGLIGLFMPNLDHILYIFVFKPLELTSQRVKILINEKRYKEALMLLYDTKEERKDLIFHSTNFQLIFAVLTFWVISSSGNLFGRGLVLGFFLSLVIKSRLLFMLILLIIFGVMV